MRGPVRWSFEGDQVEAERWRPAALQELDRLLAQLELERLEQGNSRLEFSPTAYALINVFPPSYRTIHIVAPASAPEGEGPGEFYFEFASSGYPVVVEGGAYKGCVVGVDVSASKKELRIRKAEIRTSERTLDLSAASRVGRVFDPALIDSRVSYTDESAGTFNRTVYGPNAPSNPYTGIYANSLNQEAPYLIRTDNGERESFTRRGTGFTPGFAFGEADKPVTPATVNGADWPRATGVQEVNGRLFGIYIDAYNQVVVFPIDAIGPDGQATQTKTATIDFPAWAFVPTAPANGQNYAAWKIGSPDLAWKLNHTATKAVVVLHEREVVQWDAAYIADPDTALSTQWTKAMFFGVTGTEHLFGDGATVTELYTYGRGIFEIEIRITAAGDDFTLSLVSNEVRTPRGSTRATYMVDYAWQAVDALDVKAGDLILLDLERWYEADASATFNPELVHNWTNIKEDPDLPVLTSTDFPSSEGRRYKGLDDPYGRSDLVDSGGFPTHPIRPPSGYGLFVTGRAVTFFSLRKRSGDDETELVAIAGETLLAASLSTLSVAIGVEYQERVLKSCGLSELADTTVPFYVYQGKTTVADMTHVVSHPGVAIYTQGALREVLVPDGTAQAVVDALAAVAGANPRASISGFTYMAANDLRNWSGFANLRDFQLGMQRIRCEPYGSDRGFIFLGVTSLGGFPLRLPGATEGEHPLQALNVAERNWWRAMCDFHANAELLFATNPNFGWALYTSQIIHRTQVANTTFFVHPNGSWAFFDQNRIYNTYGWPALEEPLDETTRLLPIGKAPAEFWNAVLGIEAPFFDTIELSPNHLALGSGNFLLSSIGSRQALPVTYLQMAKGVADREGGPPSTYLLDYLFSANRVIGVDFIESPPGSGFHIFVYVTVAATGTAPRTWIVNVFNVYDTTSGAINAKGLRQAIFDRVHFERDDAMLDTSFRELYAQAIANSDGDSDLREPLDAEREASFAYAPSGGFNSLNVTMTLPSGDTVSVIDSGYRNHYRDSPNCYDAISGPAGALFKYRLERGATMPPTFSSCLLLDL